MAKKTVIKKDVIEKLVNFVAAHQNNKKKLNAGQIREMVSLVVVGIGVHLVQEELQDLHDFCDADPLAHKIMKEQAIAHYETKLAELKKV